MPNLLIADVDPLYSPQNRAERLIVLGRVVLAAFSLLAIWLDPSTPSKYAETTYTLLIVYLGYALLLIPLAWRSELPLNRLGLITHIIDLPVFTLFIYLTEAPTSPLFVYFVFFMLSATLRWQWRGTLWSGLVALIVFISMGLYAAHVLHDPAFELNRFIIRSVHLIIVAIMLAYLSVYEQRLRSELSRLAAWPREIPQGISALVQGLLKNAASILDAPRVLIIWEEPEEPYRCLATYSHGEFRSTRESPTAFEPLVAGPLAESNFICPDTRAGRPTLLHTASKGWQRWYGLPIHADLQARFGIDSVLSFHLRGENLQGRLFVLDKRGMTSDELILGEIVARQITLDIDWFYLQQRLQQAAVTEERIRLARDLHDGLLQSLTGTALQLQTMHRLLEDDPQAARQRLQDIQALLAAEQRDLRSFVQQLKPAPLTPVTMASDLATQLRELADRIKQQWDLSVELRLDPGLEGIPQPLAHGVYRLIQEAVVNAARHAHASTVQVDLSMQDNQVQIMVADNGQGFPFHGRYDLAALTATQRGPVSLQGRIASLGGELVIDSSESGARLEMTLPLSR